MLDIGVGDGIHRPSDPNEPSLYFDDDGYYWFLYPLFERLAAETGQFIDLYGYAIFAGSDIVALTRILMEAKRLVEAQPATWKVQTAAAPVIHQRVKRDDFMGMLSTWERAAQRARESGRCVICFGD